MTLLVCQKTNSAKKTQLHNARQPRKCLRRKHRRIEPYAWLAAGVVGLGTVAAATAGAGVALADGTTSTSHASSASPTTGSPSASDADKPKADNAADNSPGETP